MVPLLPNYYYGNELATTGQGAKVAAVALVGSATLASVGVQILREYMQDGMSVVSHGATQVGKTIQSSLTDYFTGRSQKARRLNPQTSLAGSKRPASVQETEVVESTPQGKPVRKKAKRTYVYRRMMGNYRVRVKKVNNLRRYKKV